MYIQDESLIYKQHDCLYYALTKKNGKMILKHYYFKEAYPAIKSFFFVTYEYDNYLFKQAENKNTTSLVIQNMELDFIVPLQLIGSSILLFQYVFNYCIDYKIEIGSMWDDLSTLFKNELATERDYLFCMSRLLFQLGVLEEEYNASFFDIDSIQKEGYKKIILDALIKINPSHFQYLNAIINRHI
jgi:hypothetical protein